MSLNLKGEFKSVFKSAGKAFKDEFREMYYKGFLNKEVPLYNFKSDKIEEKLKGVFVEKKIYIDREGSKLFPTIVNKKEHDKYINLVLLVPVGLSSDYFYKNEEVFKTALDKDIEIEHQGKRIFLTIYKDNLPNRYKYSKEVTEELKGMKLAMPVGISRKGIVYLDFINTFHHLLVGGMMGSGKSVFIRQGIYSMCEAYTEDYLIVYFIDLKGGLEVKPFWNVPNVKGVAKNKLQSINILGELNEKLDRRMRIIGSFNVENINQISTKKRIEIGLPYIIIVVDELAELDSIGILERLSRLCRFAGMHLILATQRPDRKTLDGRIKANLPATVAFKVRNGVNSRILLENDKAAELPNIPGRCIFQTNTDEIVQVPYIDTQVIYDKYGYPVEEWDNIIDIKPTKSEEVKNDNQIKGNKNKMIGKIYGDDD